MEEPSGLKFMGLQRVGHDWTEHMHTHTCARAHTRMHTGTLLPGPCRVQRALFLNNSPHRFVLPPDQKRWQEAAHLQAQGDQVEPVIASHLSTQSWARAPEAEMWSVTGALLKTQPAALGRHFLGCIDWHFDLESAARVRTSWAGFPDDRWHSSRSLRPAGWAAEASRARGRLLQGAQSLPRGTDARRPVQGGDPQQGTEGGPSPGHWDGGTLTRTQGGPSPGHRGGTLSRTQGNPHQGTEGGRFFRFCLQPPWRWVLSCTSPLGKLTSVAAYHSVFTREIAFHACPQHKQPSDAVMSSSIQECIAQTENQVATGRLSSRI